MAPRNDAQRRPLMVTAREAADLLRGMRRGLRPVRGPGIKDADDGLFIPGANGRGYAVGDGASEFPSVLTAATLMTGHAARWWYTWAEITAWTSLLPSSGAIATYSTTGGRGGSGATPSGSNLGGAYNVSELLIPASPGGTTAWYVDGVQANSSNTSTSYPAGFSPRSLVYGGSRIAYLRHENWGGTTRYAIVWVGGRLTHDGTCT